MAVATLYDGTCALLTGRAGAFMSRQRIRVPSRLSAIVLIGGGIWLGWMRTR